MNDLMTKSFLSYTELKTQARKDLECELYNDLETGRTQEDQANEGSLSEFFQEVAAIKLEMEAITDLLLDLHALNEETKTAPSAKVLRGLRDRMKSNSVSVLKKAIAVKTRLHSLEMSNINRQECSDVAQTRASVTNGLRAKLTGMMRDFQALREKINEERKEELRRRYFISTGEEPSAEILEKMMTSVSVSVSSSFLGPGEKKVEFLKGKDAGIEKLEEDHEAVMEIQKSLEKLHQIFLDMAMIVESQGEKVNEVEENVVTGGWFVSGGTNSLFYANQMKKKNRKWVHWVWAIALIILLVCLVSLLSS